MTALLVVAFMALIGPLALVWGVDSRLQSDKREWLGRSIRATAGAKYAPLPAKLFAWPRGA